jgi:methylmalonyl-CoA/ethylmalonyl-CoA epimerase
MIIDHICFAVKNIQEGIEYWERTFEYKQMTNIVENTRQKANIVFLSKNDSVLIKLIEPVEGNLSLLNFVIKGGGFHHLCFKCTEINDGMKELNAKGLITLVSPQPGEAFENESIAFLLGKYGLNVELLDTKKKAGLIK